jgi:putative phosphoesterase
MPFTLQYFADLKCSLKGVLGNGDPSLAKFLWIKQKMELDLDLELDAHMLDVRLDDHRVAVVHGHSQPIVDLIIESQLYDVLAVGHDHRPRIDKVNGTLLVNPGSLVGVLLPEHRWFPYTVAIYDTSDRTARIFELE